MTTSFGSDDLRVAMVFGSGGLGAGGYYNQMGLKGLELAQTEFGVHYNYALIDSDDDFEPNLRAFAETGGYAVVMTMSFGASKALDRIATEFPNQAFAAFDAYADRPNVANYASEPRGVSFLAGAAAAWLSETGKVGTLFGVESAGYWRWVASYIAGAKFARSDIDVLWEFLKGWSPDPEDGAAAAHRLYDQGVDVIMAHLDTGDAGVFTAASERDRYAIGFNGERQLDPDRILFDVSRHLEVSVYDAIERTVKGQFETGVTKWGMRRGQYDLEFGAPTHPKMTPDLLQRIETLKREIIAGQHRPLPAKRDEVERLL